MSKSRYFVIPLLLLALLVVLATSGCTGMYPGYEKPTVTVTGLRSLPGSGPMPNFEIRLHIINPNRQALELRGIAYTVSLEGHDVIKGVANQLPVIAAYGEDDITLQASANLIAGIRLISDMLRTPQDSFDYAMEVKLDPGSFGRTIRVRDSGRIQLR
jgi:LEA14-like dessication related protein